jgi:hypothetical protein
LVLLAVPFTRKCPTDLKKKMINGQNTRLNQAYISDITFNKKYMNSQKTAQNALEDIKVSLKLKLATLWASLMFLIIYLDYFHLYMPSKLEDIQARRVFVFDITQEFLLAALASVTVPALMIFLSLAMPAKVNRWANISIAAVYIPFMLFNLAGEAWMHMVFGAAVEVVLLYLIIRYSWKWPRIET